jgi:glutamate carboxypeptidase
MILEILRHFRESVPPGWSLCALLNGDEETGSVESRDLILAEARRSAACLCLEPSKPGHCTVARKGVFTFRAETYGKAAHAGVNYAQGHSAVEAIASIIQRLYALRDDAAGVTVNVGDLRGGSGKSNVVADRAALCGEVRFADAAQAETLAAHVRKICANAGVSGVTAAFTLASCRPPMVQSLVSRALYDIAHRAAGRHGLELAPRSHGGGSDGALAASVGAPTLDGMGAEGENSHTVEEYVRKDTLMARLRLCVDVITEIMGNGKGIKQS